MLAAASAFEGIRFDDGQIAVWRRFEALAVALKTPSRGGLFRKSSSAPAGIYLWGDVGRGKSMLMDAFFANAPVAAKRRVHFHAFMLEVHARIHALRKKKLDDQVTRVAREIAGETRLLCFDEFQVHDVADAMILKTLFGTLLAEGVTLVATSNRAPDDLYAGGLQREQFLPFIVLVKERLEVLRLDGPTDYRRKALMALHGVYRYPLNRDADIFLREAFASIDPGVPEHPADLPVQGRVLHVSRAKSSVAWCTFHELCARPLAAADYLELAQEFPTLLLEGIPVLSADRRNEAKRFVTLIDVLYEHKVKLVATAAAAPDRLYPEGDGSFEFSRTASRLIEMQSDKYLGEGHRV